MSCSGSVTAPPDPEPANHVTGFTATVNSHSQITVSWADAEAGDQAPAGYLVKASTGTPTAPVDGTAESDGTLVKNIEHGGGAEAVFTGLDAETTYNFKIWPYTNSGSNIDYKTDGAVPTANATTDALPKVIITEVADHSTYQREYVEIYNAGSTTVNIDGWVIKERYASNNTDERSMTLNSTNQKNSGGSDYLLLTPGEFAIILRAETISTFTSAYGIGNNVAIFQQATAIPQMNGNERYQLEDSEGNVIDNFGSWNRSPVFEVEAGYCYERINGANSNGALEANWTKTHRDNYTYTPGTANDTSLPVTLESFTAKATKAGVLLEWSTSAEIENAGFIIRRQAAGDRNQENGTSPMESGLSDRNTEEAQDGLPLLEGEGLPASSGQAGGVLASYLTDNALVGQGSVTKATLYSFTDSKVEAGRSYIYTLSDVNFSGKETELESVTLRLRSGSAIVADNYSLMPVYPNPFNASFTVPFSLNENLTVKISLYNIAGQQVMDILNNELSAGEYHFAINADDLSSGVYFVNVELGASTTLSDHSVQRSSATGNIHSHTQKIVLMK